MTRCRDELITPRDRALASVLEPFRLATREQVDERELLRRAVSKFVFRSDALEGLVERLAADYALVRAGTHRVATYQTLYFDTPDLQCFHDHRRGLRPRHKVRLRHYPDRRLSYFEIKTEDSDGLTRKVRVPVAYGTDALPDSAHELMRAHAVQLAGPLERQLWTHFQRVTLVGFCTEERITIDFDLRVGRASALIDVKGIVIAEVKQSTFCTDTPVMTVLHDAGLTPSLSSKYCTGLALTRKDLRLGRPLPALRTG
jgi:hypothetical protein